MSVCFFSVFFFWQLVTFRSLLTLSDHNPTHLLSTFAKRSVKNARRNAATFVDFDPAKLARQIKYHPDLVVTLPPPPHHARPGSPVRLTVWQRSTVEEPLDLHVRIADGRQLTLELGDVHLDQVQLVLDLGDEPEDRRRGEGREVSGEQG